MQTCNLSTDYAVIKCSPFYQLPKCIIMYNRAYLCVHYVDGVGVFMCVRVPVYVFCPYTATVYTC